MSRARVPTPRVPINTVTNYKPPPPRSDAFFTSAFRSAKNAPRNTNRALHKYYHGVRNRRKHRDDRDRYGGGGIGYRGPVSGFSPYGGFAGRMSYGASKAGVAASVKSVVSPAKKTARAVRKFFHV